MHKAQAVPQWWTKHPRFAGLWLPPYCSRANPMERAFGDVHAKGTWHHTWKRLRDLVKEVERHMQENGSGQYKLSQRYDGTGGHRGG